MIAHDLSLRAFYLQSILLCSYCKHSYFENVTQLEYDEMEEKRGRMHIMWMNQGGEGGLGTIRMST